MIRGDVETLLEAANALYNFGTKSMDATPAMTGAERAKMSEAMTEVAELRTGLLQALSLFTGPVPPVNPADFLLVYNLAAKAQSRLPLLQVRMVALDKAWGDKTGRSLTTPDQHSSWLDKVTGAATTIGVAFAIAAGAVALVIAVYLFRK